MYSRIRVAPFAVAVLCGCGSAHSASSTSSAPAASSSSGPTTAAITERDLETRLRIIADDSMQGRETGSAGEFKTTDYIAKEFRRVGLEPAGDNGTYFQIVPFWLAAADPASRLTAGGTALVVGRDFLPTAIFATPRTLDAVDVIYAGPVNDSTRWISADQARGKVVVFDTPKVPAGRGTPFNPRRWAGAVAVALVSLDQTSSEAIARLREGRPIADSSFNSAVLPILSLSRRAATVMLGAAPETLSPGATGSKVSGHFGFTHKPVGFPARNVVGILRGSDPALRGEYVALTAHNDHVGFDHSPVDHDSVRAFARVIRPMGADSPPREPTAAEWTRIRSILDSLRRLRPARLDSIRNGADDDGTGTASILEIAEAMAQAPQRPRRSILFVSHTAEESGLLGSAWFTDHATVPLDSVVGEIDQDMVGRGLPTDFPRGGVGAGSPTYLEVVGDQKLSRAFAATLDAANARQSLPFVFDRSYAEPGHPLQYYCRADHYNYARYGIPAVALSRGEHLDYHQVTDEAQYIDYPDFARVTQLVYDAAIALANADARPALDVAKPTNPHAPCRQ